MSESKPIIDALGRRPRPSPRSRSMLCTASLAALAVATFAARTASAQPAPPNPFEDYDRFVAGEPATSPGAPSVFRGSLRTSPFTWSVGLRSQISFSRLTYQRGPGENDGAATALLFRLSPALYLFVYDRIQVGLSPGLMVRAGGNNIGDDATDGNFLIEGTVHYFAPVSPRFSFVPGLGVGGYFGAGKRKTDAGIPGMPVRVDRDSKTSGLSLALYMGVAYQIDARLQIRSGLTGSVYFGWDHLQGRREGRVHNSTTHVGIPIELFYVF
jgi:hypothetical protein